MTPGLLLSFRCTPRKAGDVRRRVRGDVLPLSSWGLDWMVVGVGGFGQSCLRSDCKSCSWEGEGFVRGMGIRRGYFQSGRSVRWSFAVPHSLLQLWPPANIAPIIYTYYLWHSTASTAMISRRTWIRKRYFCVINVIKCFVKCNVTQY